MRSDDEIRALVAEAHEWVGDLCTGKRQWRMRVPVDPHDSDVVISEALNDAEALLARAVRAEAERDALVDKNRALAEKCRDLDMDACVARLEVPQQRAIWHDEFAAIVAERDAAQAKIAAVEKVAQDLEAEAMRMKAVWHSAHDRHDHGSMVATGVAVSRLRRALGLPADTTDPNR